MRRPLLSTLLFGAAATTCLLTSSAKPQDAQPAFWQVIERAVAKQDVGKDFRMVLEHMAGVPKERDYVPHRLSRVDQGLIEPWAPPALAADLKQRLAKPASDRLDAAFQNVVPDIAQWLDLIHYSEQSKSDEMASLNELWRAVRNPKTKGVDLLNALSAYVAQAQLLLSSAHDGLNASQQSLLWNDYPAFYDIWAKRHDPDQELDEAQVEMQSAYTTLFAELKSDRERILAVSESLLGLSGPTFMKSLAKRLSNVHQKGVAAEYGEDILAVVGDSADARVILSGTGRSLHKQSAALIIDLGGDDIYENAAVAESQDRLVSLVIELGGQDHYQAGNPGPVFTAGGVALLVDRKGDDTYESGRLGQAASILGFAALIDFAGNDTYRAHDYSQGHSTCGVALLYDLGGQDTYRAHAFAQGGGIGNGLCALVDAEGDDEYVADEHWPDVYGNSGPDVYHGASQGFSTGIRSNVAGGIAALIDLGKGKDRYQAGSFSQGGGYYFAFGLMFDGGGDDQAFGSRYAQGFGVHQGIGVKWDAGGDDLYKCRSVAHAGMAWDEGVGYLLDDAGDDIYQVGDLGCGGAAQTGIAICIDSAGKDRYQTGRSSQGGTGASQYHDKPSIGVLIDLGGDKDEYTMEERANETLRATEGVQIFLDCSAKKMPKALRAKSLR